MIRLFEDFNKVGEIHTLCIKYNIFNYTINDDYSIDVNDDVDLSNSKLDYLPLTFGYVSGHFDCRTNRLTSLKGCPKEVGKSFYCSNNKLVNLEYCPEKIGRSLFCEDNMLTSLDGSPVEIPEHFNCANNELSSLKGSPKIIGDSFFCYDNKLPDRIIKSEISPKIIVKYQDEYNIWYSDGKLNEARFDILVSDFIDGFIS